MSPFLTKNVPILSEMRDIGPQWGTDRGDLLGRGISVRVDAKLGHPVSE